MFAELIRYSSVTDTSLSLLYLDGLFQCYILEDGKRTIKVWGETRIPSGRYKVELKTFGGFHDRYLKNFPNMHMGMIWIRDVPNFEGILFHIGNDKDDTAGCLLSGDVVNNNTVVSGNVNNSTVAYKRVYPIWSQGILSGDSWISVIDWR
jgi:hypothetical protein